MFKNKKIGNLWLFHFLADFSAIVAAYYTAFVIRFHLDWGERIFTVINRLLRVGRTGELGEEFEVFYIESAPRIVFFLTVTLCVLYALRNLYTGRRFIRRRPVAWNVVVANVIALGLFYAYFYLRRNIFHPRSYFATLIFFNIIYCVASRAMINHFMHVMRSRFGIDQCRAVLLGFNQEANFINSLIEVLHPHGIHIIDRIGFKQEEPFEGLIEKLGDSVSGHGADMIISADKRLSVAQIMRLLELAGRLDVSAKVLSDKMEVLVTHAKMPVDMIHGVPLIHFEAPSAAMRSGLARRGMSTIFAWVMTLVVLPFMGLIALLLRLTSHGGPALFVQERIGVNRKPFQMYKFRTMHERADEFQAQVEEFNESGKGLFKIREDPRVTWIGRFLRRFSLDELPQLMNVIRGEMTIVGPRPLPRRDFENYYEEWHYSRHSAMPGLTCLWQVSGRSELDFHNMCILDVFYLRNQSWVLDLKIFLKTFWVVLFAKGAY